MVDTEKENKALSLDFLIMSALEKLGEFSQSVTSHPATPALLRQLAEMVDELKKLKEELMEERMKELEDEMNASTAKEKSNCESCPAEISVEDDFEHKRVVATVLDNRGEPLPFQVLKVTTKGSNFFVCTDDAGQAFYTYVDDATCKISLTEDLFVEVRSSTAIAE